MENLLTIGELTLEEIGSILGEAAFWKATDPRFFSNSVFEVNANPIERAFENKHILIVGDILHSRVARSNLELLTKLGAKVTFVAPPSLLPSDLSKLPEVQIETNFDSALKRAEFDAIMLLRIQAERMLGGSMGASGSENAGYFPSLVEYVHGFGLTNERIKKVNPKIPILHPAPINRGLEITSEIADSAQSLINHQIANGVFVRTAILRQLVTKNWKQPKLNAEFNAENSETQKPLSGKTVVNLFYENSTRTRFSFEAAEKRLGANVTNFSPSASSVAKGESLKDTVTTLFAIGIDAIVLRHQDSGAAFRLANSSWIPKTPVINAGDGTHAHPTQALLDAMTLWEHFSGFSQIHKTTSPFGKLI